MDRFRKFCGRWAFAAMLATISAGPADFFTENAAHAANGTPNATTIARQARTTLMGAPYRMSNTSTASTRSVRTGMFTQSQLVARGRR